MNPTDMQKAEEVKCGGMGVMATDVSHASSTGKMFLTKCPGCKKCFLFNKINSIQFIDDELNQCHIKSELKSFERGFAKGCEVIQTKHEAEIYELNKAVLLTSKPFIPDNRDYNQGVADALANFDETCKGQAKGKDV